MSSDRLAKNRMKFKPKLKLKFGKIEHSRNAFSPKPMIKSPLSGSIKTNRSGAAKLYTVQAK